MRYLYIKNRINAFKHQGNDIYINKDRINFIHTPTLFRYKKIVTSINLSNTEYVIDTNTPKGFIQYLHDKHL